MERALSQGLGLQAKAVFRVGWLDVQNQEPNPYYTISIEATFSM